MIATMNRTEQAGTQAEIQLVHPMPGFPDETGFQLVSLDEGGLLSALESTTRPGLRFLVVPPQPFFPDYAPVIDDETVADLGLVDAEEAVVLLVVHAGASLASTTVNLRAPIVVNTTNRRALQVVLDGPDGADLAVAAPLLG